MAERTYRAGTDYGELTSLVEMLEGAGYARNKDFRVYIDPSNNKWRVNVRDTSEAYRALFEGRPEIGKMTEQRDFPALADKMTELSAAGMKENVDYDVSWKIRVYGGKEEVFRQGGGSYEDAVAEGEKMIAEGYRPLHDFRVVWDDKKRVWQVILLSPRSGKMKKGYGYASLTGAIEGLIGRGMKEDRRYPQEQRGNFVVQWSIGPTSGKSAGSEFEMKLSTADA